MDQRDQNSTRDEKREVSLELTRASQDMAIAYVHAHPANLGQEKLHDGQTIWNEAIAQNPRYAGSIAALAHALHESYEVQRSCTPLRFNAHLSLAAQVRLYGNTRILDTSPSAQMFLADLIIYRLYKGKEDATKLFESLEGSKELVEEAWNMKENEIRIHDFEEYQRIGSLTLQRLMQFILEGRLSIERPRREEYTA